jgi:hypothetical protein
MRAYTAHAACEHQHHEIVEHLFLSINASNRGKTAERDSDLTSYHTHKDTQTKTHRQTYIVSDRRYVAESCAQMLAQLETLRKGWAIGEQGVGNDG